MGASLVNAVQGMGPVHFWIATAFALVFAVAGFYSAFRYLAQARILEDIPTSRVRSASQGYVELQGLGRLLDGPPIVAPLTQTRCTWWEYRIEKHTGSRRRRWTTIRRAVSDELFALEDDSGFCIVDPEGAEVYPMITRRWYGDSARPARPRPRRRFARGRYRYTEKRMHEGDPLYAVGHFRTRYLSERLDADAEVGELLRQWKQDRAGLLDRFDANNDGEIDLAEWEHARVAARRQIRAEHRQLQARPGLSIMSAPQNGRPFLLGALPQPDLASKLRRRAAAGIAMLLVAGTGLAVLLTGRFGL